MRVKDIRISRNLSVDELVELINTASKFESEILIKSNSFTIDAKSLMGVISMIIPNITITLVTKGEDEEEALQEVSRFFIEKMNRNLY